MKNKMISAIIQQALTILEKEVGLAKSSLEVVVSRSFKPISDFFREEKEASYSEDLINELNELYPGRLQAGAISRNVYNLRTRGTIDDEIENTFKNTKNQKHLSFNPQFHWTDQKIIVHNFCCVIGYLLSTIAFKTAKDKGFKGTMDSFLDSLSKIRLGTILESTNKKGRPKAVYKLEEMEANEQILAEHLNITHLHENVYKPKGFSVYT